MVELYTIFSDIAYNNADVYMFPMGNLAVVATINAGGETGIFINNSKPTAISALKGNLMHEDGHMATGTTHELSSPFDLVEKHEYVANKYMAVRFLTVEEFEKVFRAGYRHSWELAEYFDMPEKDIKYALHYWTECMGVDFNADISRT